MQSGISIWAYSCPIPEAIRHAGRLGFEVIELALNETGPMGLDVTRQEIDGYKAIAQEAGIALPSLATGLYWSYGFTANDPTIRQKGEDICKKQLEAAAMLGADTILVVPGSVSSEVRYDTAYQRAQESLSRLAPMAQACGVKIGVENVWNKFLLSPVEFRRFLDELNHPYIGAYFDVGNVLVSGYPEHWIDILDKHLFKLHFKDFRTGVGSIQGFCDMLEGDVDYKAVMAALQRVGYNGPAVAEVGVGNKDYADVQYIAIKNAMDAILKA